MELKNFISFKVHVPPLCHCGGRSTQSGRENSRDIECNQRSREVPVRIAEWGSTTPVT